MQYHEGQREYCSSYPAQRWQMRVDQMFLFEMLEQLDRRAPPNADDAAQAPWRPTRSCQSSTKVRVHVGICAPRRTSWTGSCDAPGASGIPHEWRLRCDHISVFSESDVQQSEGRTAVVGDELHRHDSEHCCSSRFDLEWMRAPASLRHPSSTDGEPTRAAEVDRSNFWRAVVCEANVSSPSSTTPKQRTSVDTGMLTPSSSMLLISTFISCTRVPCQINWVLSVLSFIRVKPHINFRTNSRLYQRLRYVMFECYLRPHFSFKHPILSQHARSNASSFEAPDPLKYSSAFVRFKMKSIVCIIVWPTGLGRRLAIVLPEVCYTGLNHLPIIKHFQNIFTTLPR